MHYDVVPAGHPYLTPQLAAQRASQRRLLRSIPRHWLRWAGDFHGPDQAREVYAAADGPMIETVLRRAADETLDAADGEVRSLIAAVDQAEELEAAATWLLYAAERSRTRTIHSMAGDPLDTAAAALRSKAAPLSVHADVELPPDVARPLAQVIGLLVLADELAGDYSDPRLSTDT